MGTSKTFRRATGVATQAALTALLCGLVMPASAQLVDLHTTTIDGQGNAQSAALRQVQAQIEVQTPPPTIVPQPAPLRRSDPNPAPQREPAPTSPQAPVPSPLNFDPNADINDLVPQQPPPPAEPQQAQQFNLSRQRGLGLTAGSFSSAPTMIGDFFGGPISGFSGTVVVPFTGYSPGTIISGGPGLATSTLAFEFGADVTPNDVFTTGVGSDLAGGDGFADSFAIAEPIPPNDALTSPGPGFIFDGGTAVYTNNTTSTTPQPGLYTNGQDWYISYSYSQAIGAGGARSRPAPGPGVAVRRIKISENFSPEVRNRCFANYSYFNDAIGGLGDVSRYIIGGERIIWEDLVSLEARLPMAGTYGSTQVLEQDEDRNFEWGNAALILKGVLLADDRFIWSGGLGVALPLADDTRIQSGGSNLLVVQNKTVHILPFTALLLRRSRKTNLQIFAQMDIAANGDPVYGDLTGTSLPKIGVFNDSTLLYVDSSISHLFYENRRSRYVRQMIANAELHYSGTLQGSDLVQSGNLSFTNLSRHFDVVNATLGMHLVLANNLIVTPAMSIPLRRGFDKQFDYEANVQINLLR